MPGRQRRTSDVQQSPLRRGQLRVQVRRAEISRSLHKGWDLRRMDQDRGRQVRSSGQCSRKYPGRNRPHYLDHDDVIHWKKYLLNKPKASLNCTFSKCHRNVVLKVCLKKWANPGLFFIYFRLFKHTLQFLQQINVKKCPSSIRYWDSNPWPFGHESPPITTRPVCLIESVKCIYLLRNLLNTKQKCFT